MPYVMKLVGIAGLGLPGFFPTPKYLRSVDFEHDEGRGSVELADTHADAMKFATSTEAMQFWQTQSKTVPLRPDGLPNRPLTAYHAMVEQCP